MNKYKEEYLNKIQEQTEHMLRLDFPYLWRGVLITCHNCKLSKFVPWNKSIVLSTCKGRK